MQTLKLNTGASMPALGLGTWESKPGEVALAVKYAILNAGYRHIDGAMIYQNEAEIGQAYREIFSGKVSRESVFVTGKLWNTHHRPENVEKGIKQTLKDLQLDYLDLYLVHWGLSFPLNTYPSKNGRDGFAKLDKVSIQETWQAMEALVPQGLVKAIGVANFTPIMISDLLSYAQIKPAVNQVEVHPYNSQSELIEYCNRLGIVVTAYSPLGTPGTRSQDAPNLLEDQVVVSIANALGKSPAQVLLRWAIQRGTAVIPKSTNPMRIMENSAIFDFELAREDMDHINSLNKNHRYVDPSNLWGVPYFK